MNDTILLVIGGANTGKTIAATNVFSAMTMGGGIQNKNETVRFELVAKDAWDVDHFTEDYMAMLNGKPLPIGTTENLSYELIFRVGSEDVTSILYMDYRGGILHDRNTPEQELKDFDYMLSHSSLLVYIIPGDILNDYILLNGKGTGDLPRMTQEERKRFMRVNAAYNHINVVMNRLNNITDKKTKSPILFYVTKADLVTGGKEALIPGLKRLIAQYGLGTGRPVLGCYSTLGWEVEIVEVQENRKMIPSGLDPYGFEIPMMLTVGYRLSQAGKQWAAEEEKRLDQCIAYCEQREKDALVQAGHIANQRDTFWQSLNVFNKKKREAEKKRKVQEQMDNAAHAQKDEQQAQNEKANLDQKNTDRQNSQKILQYLKEKYDQDGILYLDEEHNEKPLDEFFR